MGTAKDLDQYYTIPETSKECSDIFKRYLKYLNYNLNEITYIEPSAGTGSFLPHFPKNQMIAYDLDPKHPLVKKQDFLKLELRKEEGKEYVVIGNPPFGKKATLSIEFFNKCCEFSDTIGFIIPIQFRKWSVQSKLNEKFRLILDFSLKEESFIFENKLASVRCCFQIWSTKALDFRLKKSPATYHNDFKMWQYNNTKSALKFFDEEFDFAVPRQGYKDYSIRETNKDNCDKKTQWILFKASNKKVLDNLLNIDFNLLSKKNTSTPGFGKADVVEYYNELYL